ncbi:hypothetical protein MPRM_30490 [Mycobacterium parmense]|uniref:Uncharacterized protein n=1 Tax=Mycobacterium parmense TaxID=185642 RepID=A0A7I7YV67_9MYCO|nr:hypothetical protein MPRM_30490 [Mycobacterium parmense]
MTVVPARTVNVAGAKAKSSMLTWLAPAGAAVRGAVAVVGETGAAGPAWCGAAEHPAIRSAPTAIEAMRVRGITIMPEDKAAGYTDASGRRGANTSITPSISRTIKVGNGFGAIGN